MATACSVEQPANSLSQQVKSKCTLLNLLSKDCRSLIRDGEEIRYNISVAMNGAIASNEYHHLVSHCNVVDFKELAFNLKDSVTRLFALYYSQARFNLDLPMPLKADQVEEVKRKYSALLDKKKEEAFSETLSARLSKLRVGDRPEAIERLIKNKAEFASFLIEASKKVYEKLTEEFIKDKGLFRQNKGIFKPASNAEN